jgi:hypothetical protein
MNSIAGRMKTIIIGLTLVLALQSTCLREVYSQDDKTRGKEIGSNEGAAFKLAKAQEASGQTAQAASIESAQAENQSAEEMATVYIYRPGKLVGKALEPSVFCDGVELARMDNGRFLMLRLKPGRHTVHMTDKKKGYEVDMGRGQQYYFRVGIELGMWKGQGKILLEDNEKGAADVKKLKPLDRSKIKDQTMVVVEPIAPAKTTK